MNKKAFFIAIQDSFESVGIEDLLPFSLETLNTDSFDQFNSEVEALIWEQEIVYYSAAIKYLSENDPSLTDSVNIALEYGYTLESVNSEVLASLLLQQKYIESWHSISDEVEQLFDEYQNSEEVTA